MNLYFLVEGRRTEKKVYPKWLSYLLPKLIRVNSYDAVNQNNYYLISAEGYPSIIYDSLPASIEDINSSGKYDYFVVCLDADESTVDERKKEIYDFIDSEKLELNKAKMAIIIQNRCFETWFLGHRKIYTRNPQKDLLEYTRYYDISVDDPELMGKGDRETHASFHLAYLKALFESKNITYSKRNPGDVLKKFYLDELLKRIEDRPQHLRSFGKFRELCEEINKKI